MALINCPDCNKQVSSNAPTCPGCGAPIAGTKEASGSGVQQLQTIQETSKKLKLQSVYSLSLFVAGAILLFASPKQGPPTGPAIAAVMMLTGGAWYLVNRYRIWWHHK